MTDPQFMLHAWSPIQPPCNWAVWSALLPFYVWSSRNLSLDKSSKARKWQNWNLKPYLSDSGFFNSRRNRPGIFLRLWKSKLLFTIKKHISVGFFIFFFYFFFLHLRSKTHAAKKTNLEDEIWGFLIQMELLESTQNFKVSSLGCSF